MSGGSKSAFACLRLSAISMNRTDAGFNSYSNALANVTWPLALRL